MRLVFTLLPAVLLAACFTTPDRCPINPSDPAHETFASTLGVDITTME